MQIQHELLTNPQKSRVQGYLPIERRYKYEFRNVVDEEISFIMAGRIIFKLGKMMVRPKA